ncbi:MAG TPA: hypothetical protein VFP23_05970 [Solirubrobacterales bacterium]|nr:hypothetical protein [Solirubrobacterales bacterium]
MAISLTALFLALGGTVYAAGKARVNGRTIVVKSLPGNRLKLHSVAANRLRPGAISASALSGQLSGAQIDARTLGQVPNAGHAVSADSADNAAHAETADSAQHAAEADMALNAVNAIAAETVNGHEVGCKTGTVPFAGSCWQTSPDDSAPDEPENPPVTAPKAAENCAKQGGTLPGALELAAFAKRPDVTLDAGDEWSSDLTNFSGPNSYAIVTVSATGVLNSAAMNLGRRYRCVFPLVH